MNTATEPIQLDQASRGIYDKYHVTRTDGQSAPGQKHEHDKYFVLELSDKHALRAMNAYAKSCEDEYPVLAADLRSIVRESMGFNDQFVTVPETTLPDGTVVPSFLCGKFHCSQADGLAVIDPYNQPWNKINYHDARKACSDAGYALITELQYLAIAYQITQQPDNWTSGKVGEGEVYRGLHIGTLDCAQAGFHESTEPTERRWHVVANDERIYDMSGNIYSWVFDDVQGDENGVIAKKFDKKSPTVTTAPYKSREHGIGDTGIGGGDWRGNALVRGGCWSSGDRAGVFGLNRDWPDGDYQRVGFRCTKGL